MRTVTLRIQDSHRTHTSSMEHLPIGGWRGRVIIAVARLIARRWFFDAGSYFWHC